MMKRQMGVLVVVTFLLLINSVFAADVYQVDPIHSNVAFRVRHLGVSYVTGKFDKFEGRLTFDGDKLSSLEGTVDTTSIDTAQPNRDEDLRSANFFAVDKFPTMKFQSTKITQTGNTIAVVGNLTIRDITKIVELQGEFGGFVNMGKTKKTGLTLEGEINRRDFGLQFNKLLESGQAMVGDQVKITLELEAASTN